MKNSMSNFLVYPVAANNSFCLSLLFTQGVGIKIFRIFQNALIGNYYNINHIIVYRKCMTDEKFFLLPVSEWQRRYEALRASFVDRLPAKVVADRFGYSPSYVNLLRHQFSHGKIDFSEPVPEGKINTRAGEYGYSTKDLFLAQTQSICWRNHPDAIRRRDRTLHSYCQAGAG